MKPCLFCVLDEHKCSDGERRAAYYVLGTTGDDCPTPCAAHVRAMMLGAAVISEAVGAPGGGAAVLRELARQSRERES